MFLLSLDGIESRAIVESGEIIEPLRDRIVGRVTLENITDPFTNALITSASEVITEVLASTIEALFSRTGLPAATHPLLKAGGGGGGESPTRCHEAVRGAQPAGFAMCVAQPRRACGAGGVHRGRCDVRGGDGRGAVECGAERLEPAARYATAPETHPHAPVWPFGG